MTITTMAFLTKAIENRPTPIEIPREIFIPEGFSPNGDNENDLFVILGTEGKKVSIWVYNRWGNIVYENNNYQNDWNGTTSKGLVVLGDQLPDGTYYYVIDLNDGSKQYVRYLTIKR
jgi:gliding motility-associated-like protein